MPLLLASNTGCVAMVPLLGSIESFLIFLLLAVGSAAFNWLKERNKDREERSEPPPPPRPRYKPLTQSTPTPAPPQPRVSVMRKPSPSPVPLPKEHWERKLQEVLQKERAKLSTPVVHHQPHAPAPSFSTANVAYDNASHLDEQVAARMDQLTRHPVQMTHAQTRLQRTQTATDALALVRSPQGVRQAMLASMILAPPKSLE